MAPSLSRGQAEQQILDLEKMIEALFLHFDPEQVAGEAARRFRRISGPETLVANPPHAMLRAIEASCAYFNPFARRSLAPGMFEELLAAVMAIEEVAPVLLLEEHGFMSFMAYMHQSQLRHQRPMWVVPVGRAEMLFADRAALPRTAAAFASRFGLSPRQWIQMAFVAYAATRSTERLGFNEAYLHQLESNGVPGTATKAFLAEVSQTPLELGRAYRLIRNGNETIPKCDPWTWYQRAPLLSEYPIMRVRSGWGVPAPSLLVPLFDELLFKRLAQVATGELRDELSEAFANYIARVFESQLPGCRIVRERALRGADGGKVADLAVELSNAVLLIEVKSVIFDRQRLTETALLSGPAQRLIEGAIQVAQTAERITKNGCPAARLLAGKPIVGAIATFGTFPHGNADQLFERGRERFEADGLHGSNLTPSLYCRPIVLGSEAVESLAVYLRSNPEGLMSLIDEKAACNIHQAGDWPLFMNRKIAVGDGHDLGLWRSAFNRLLSDWGPPDEATGPARPH